MIHVHPISALGIAEPKRHVQTRLNHSNLANSSTMTAEEHLTDALDNDVTSSGVGMVEDLLLRRTH